MAKGKGIGEASLRLAARFALASFAIMCLVPMLLVLIVSVTDEGALVTNGYSFFPSKLSLSAYIYALSGGMIAHAYLVTILATAVGTTISLLITSLYAYAISRKDFGPRKLFLRLAVFTMLFNGGLVPWYLVCTQVLHLRDTFMGLVVPYVINAYFLVIMKTYFQSGIPDSLIESAKIDGAGEFTIFFRIVIQISTPALASVGLFIAVGYWNDWWLPMMFVEDRRLVNLQFMLYKIQNNLTFLTSGLVKTSNALGSVEKMPAESARMAIAVLAAGPVVLFLPLAQKYFVKGLTMGSVKE
jgi:putative aldouronate transport system permease protein